MRHPSEVGAAEDEAFLTNLAVNRESRLPLKTQKLDSKAARGGKDPGYRRFGTRVKFGFRFFMGQECPCYLKRRNLGVAFFGAGMPLLPEKVESGGRLFCGAGMPLLPEKEESGSNWSASPLDKSECYLGGDLRLGNFAPALRTCARSAQKAKRPQEAGVLKWVEAVTILRPCGACASRGAGRCCAGSWP